MCKSEGGFSLLEVLVSAFVLAFGVIAAIGMQLTAFRTTQQSAFQTHALHLAADMADRMRANLTRMQLSDPDNPYLQVDYQSGQSASASGVDCYRADADCDASQVAQFDIEEWLLRLDQALPNARARICRDAVLASADAGASWDCDASKESGPVVIKIGWRDKEQRSEDSGNAAPALVLTVASFPT
jgi:type IV pilus assembly protein PilV